MRAKLADIFLNSVLPVVLGGLLYVAGKDLFTPGFINNHLADGLWAYAFLSSILIIWERSFHLLWIAACFGLAIVFEWLQFKTIIAGTGDWLDVLTYFTGFLLSLCLNNRFRTIYAT